MFVPPIHYHSRPHSYTVLYTCILQNDCTIYEGDLIQYATQTLTLNQEDSELSFDIVTGTPPYFPTKNGALPLDAGRGQCAFECRGGIEVYIETCSKLISKNPSAKFIVCQTYLEVKKTEMSAEKWNMEITKRLDVYGKVGQKNPLFCVFSMRRRREIEKETENGEGRESERGTETEEEIEEGEGRETVHAEKSESQLESDARIDSEAMSGPESVSESVKDTSKARSIMESLVDAAVAAVVQVVADVIVAVMTDIVKQVVGIATPTESTTTTEVAEVESEVVLGITSTTHSTTTLPVEETATAAVGAVEVETQVTPTTATTAQVQDTKQTYEVIRLYVRKECGCHTAEYDTVMREMGRPLSTCTCTDIK